LNIKNGVKETIEKLKHKKIEILSDEEINDICISSRFAGMFINVVEIIYADVMLQTGLLKGDELDRLCGNPRKRQYVCSIYAGNSSVVKVLESYLRGEQIGIKKIPEDKIRRIGLYGFWHYFVECKHELLCTLREGAMMFSKEKVVDVIRKNQFPSCSIAHILK